jgi:hypothetical protein
MRSGPSQSRQPDSRRNPRDGPHDTSHSLGEHETGDVALTATASIIADVLLLAQTRGQDVAAILALATVYVADSRANHDAAYALTPDAATALVDTLHPDTVTHAPHPDAADLAEATADIYATD